ncbi:MAG: DUF3852 family protein [Bacteroidales bacterium]|nr:DUF3852 family protein [Bacteroidales bacterium]
MKNKKVNVIHKLSTILFMITYSITTVSAKGDVSGVIQESWNNAESQIRSVVDNVIFPALSIILAIFLFIKLGSSYFDYKKNNDRFEWTAPSILFVCLVFTLTAPKFIWKLL